MTGKTVPTCTSNQEKHVLAPPSRDEEEDGEWEPPMIRKCSLIVCTASSTDMMLSLPTCTPTLFLSPPPPLSHSLSLSPLLSLSLLHPSLSS